MDCHRAEELLSDRLFGSLHPILAAELEAHLAGCEACRQLAEAFAEVVAALHSAPELDAPVGLAERAALAALARPRTIEIRPAFVLPQFLLCGLLAPREEMTRVLELASYALPLTYAYDALDVVTRTQVYGGWFAVDVAVVAGGTVLALALGALTLRRRTG